MITVVVVGNGNLHVRFWNFSLSHARAVITAVIVGFRTAVVVY